MKIALTCSIKKKDKAPDRPPDYYSEFDSEETVLSIAAAIKNLSHEVVLVEANNPKHLLSFFQNNSVDLVFNIAEGSDSKFRESEVPALLDFFRIPYTGSCPFALALALDKAMAKRAFMAENIPTPRFQIFDSLDRPLDHKLKFPLIVKPNCEGSGKGISVASVVYKKEDLYKQIERTLETYKHEVLVEEFIEGKEITVGVLGNVKASALPILEVDFSNCHASGEYFYSWKMKEFQGNKEMGCVPDFYCPARLSEETTDIIKEVALRAHKVLGCHDISRTDIRLSHDNIPYVLEVNPLPGLDPQESNFPMMSRAAGITYPELIKTILHGALERYGLKNDAGSAYRSAQQGILRETTP